MQTEGKVRFLRNHQGSVRGVAFHPKDHYLFCSGAYDGKINIYSAQKYEFLHSYAVTTVSLARNINGVRFTSDGSRILATTTARRMAVIDVEKGEQILSYDNCAFNGRDRTGLAVDPASPNMVACCCVNGKGVTLFDLRMSPPLDFLYDMHSGVIRDIMFLHESWPWCKGQKCILSVASDGVCKVSTLDGRLLHQVDTGQGLNSVTATPESYGSASDDGFASVLMFGGETASAYVPDSGIQEHLKESNEIPIWKLRYTASGSVLYTACDQGVIRRYRRWPDHHGYLGEVFRHKGDVQDMDISPYDEYLVTASKDRSVGVIRLGGPNHGSSEYGELT
jgi:WD40 repeat protein